MMKFTYNWLKEHVDLKMSPDELVALLPTIGIGVEKHEKVADGDTSFFLEVTSNRPDCLGIIGIAREIAACTGARLRAWPEAGAARVGTKRSTAANSVAAGQDEQDRKPASLRDERTGFVLAVDEPNLCARYVARLIEETKVGPSPDWLRNRLEAIGLRSVNNVVDVTNYVLFETGQPLHAFDCDRLTGNTIRVRLARRGEKIAAIDGREYELDEKSLVIADESRPVAIAGVMGGQATEVGERTKRILLESACFNGPSIRRTSRRLALASDSSYRFERQVDEIGVETASRRAAELIVAVAGGRISDLRLDCHPAPVPRRTVSLRLARAVAVLGCAIERADALKRLSSLGFEPARATAHRKLEETNRRSEKQPIEFVVPSYRSDVSREEDMIEEIARIVRYDSIPDTPALRIASAGKPRELCVESAVREALCACGYSESLGLSFADSGNRQGLPIDGPIQPVGILGRDGHVEKRLRLTLLESLVQVCEGNRAYGMKDVRIFEIAKRYFVGPSGESTERMSLAILDTDGFRPLKGALKHVCDRVGLAMTLRESTAELGLFHGSAIADVVLGADPAGVLGEVRLTGEKGGDSSPVFALEVDFSILAAKAVVEGKYRRFSRLPAVVRDLAYVVAEETRWRSVEESVRAVAPPYLEDVRLFDEYRGKNIPAGSKSIA
ncbi:MAG: phenylalanine--tRNA ligase subunit beta, partial [Planctomycetota bacterium]|nr:phenylalanine--tRNA ligase subunit beta [Planctomycetota bacterium]